MSAPSKTMNLYRIFPVLWNQGTCTQAQTVYAVDRAPPPNTFPTSCSARPQEDPAYFWDNQTFHRLLPPAGCGGCYQPASLNGVTWPSLPSWLSFVQTKGYTVTTDLSTLKPYSDVYITGP
jgi:hypothetical protein